MQQFSAKHLLLCVFVAWSLPVSAQIPAVTLSPTSGTGTAATFTVGASAPSGYNIYEIYFLVSDQYLSSADCEAAVMLDTNQFWLLDSTQTRWLGPVTPISGGGLDNNSTCNVTASVSGSGSAVTAYFSVSFEAGYTGSKVTWVAASSESGGNTYTSPWTSTDGRGGLSSWTIPSAQPTVTLVNLTTTGNNNLFAVGDDFRITVTGPPNQTVTATSVHDGVGSSETFGNTPSGGSPFVITGAMQLADRGSWTEDWYVGGAHATPQLSFSVFLPAQPCGGYAVALPPASFSTDYFSDPRAQAPYYQQFGSSFAQAVITTPSVCQIASWYWTTLGGPGSGAFSVNPVYFGPLGAEVLMHDNGNPPFGYLGRCGACNYPQFDYASSLFLIYNNTTNSWTTLFADVLLTINSHYDNP